MTTTSVPDRGPTSVYASMMGVGRLLRRCKVYQGTSLQYHPYIGEVTVTEVSTEGTQASTAKIPVTSHKMTPKTLTVEAAVSEIDLGLPGFRTALDEAVTKALTNAVEQEVAKAIHTSAGAATVVATNAALLTRLGVWIVGGGGDQVDITDGMILVARQHAGVFFADFPAQDRAGDIHNVLGLDLWFGTGVPDNNGVICNPQDVHVVFYGEPRVVPNPYGNPLLHSVTGIANVGIAVMGNTTKAFKQS